jgi:hypothetical protein
MWSPDGRFITFVMHSQSMSGPWGSKTSVFALRAGQMFPPLPSSGISSIADLERLPGLRAARDEFLLPGPDPSVYAFMKRTAQRNIFRIPLR